MNIINQSQFLTSICVIDSDFITNGLILFSTIAVASLLSLTILAMIGRTLDRTAKTLGGLAAADQLSGGKIREGIDKISDTIKDAISGGNNSSGGNSNSGGNNAGTQGGQGGGK
jgi:hypothetical protein